MINIKHFLEFLDKQEGEVLIMRFGLEGGKCHTLDEVGNKFGISREDIRIIETKALNLIKGNDVNNRERELQQILASAGV